MDIDSDSDLEMIVETDGNQNISKVKMQKHFMDIGTTIKTDDAPPPIPPNCQQANASAATQIETIDLIDSDDDESDKATEHVSEHVSHENSNYIWQQSQEVKVVSVIDPKPSTSNTGADKNQQEPMSDVEEITEQREPISTRLRSRRANVKSYCETINCDDDDNDDDARPSTSNQVNSDFKKSATKPFFTLDPSQIPKNDDKTIFHSNFLYKSFCLLCGVSDKHLAIHYARKHPETEVFIARVSPTMAARIRDQTYNFIRIKNDIHGLCFFCEEMKILTKEDWMKHLLMHTGEQQYYCTCCQKSLPRKMNHENCSRDKVEHIFGQTSKDDDLTGFICNTCNYVQINENQFTKHLAEHENFIEISGQLFSRVVLVQVSQT